MSINQVTISGNLTRDAELRTTSGGMAVLGFGVAVNDRRKNQQTGEWEDYPNFIDCTLFGRFAEAIAPYMLKGTKVALSGKLRYSSWEKDGQHRSKLEVIASEVEIMSAKEHQGKSMQAQWAVAHADHSVSTAPTQQVVDAVRQATAAPLYDSDIPF